MVLLTPASTTSPLPHETHRVEIPEVASFGALEPGPWRVAVHRRGYWAQPTTLLVKDGETTRGNLVLWPTTRLLGVVEAPRTYSLPEVLRIGFLRPSDVRAGDSPPESIVSCPIEKSEGTFSCGIPAGLWHLRLQASGFVPHYLWLRHLEPAGSVPLGRLSLTPGSSLSGFVPQCRGQEADRTCIASVEPLVSRTMGGGPAREKLTASISREPVNRFGFFQLSGLPAGAYRLRVEKKGFADRSFFPITIHPGAESQLAEPLALFPPLSLAVRITPSHSPSGRPWRLEVQELGSNLLHRRRVEPEEPVTTGEWRFQGLSSGGYEMTVTDSAGNRWLVAQAQLRDAEERVELRLPLFELKGRIFLGDEPLAANLFFGGERGAERSIRARSDSEGTFSTLLPASGLWRLGVRSEDEAIEREIGILNVPEPDESGLSELEIHLPDTEISGQVVDEGGRAVSHAQVTAQFAEIAEVKSRRAGADGRFRFRGMSFGSGRLWAGNADGTGESDEISFQLSAALPTVDQTLVLRPVEEVQGILTAFGGRPVVGAQVSVVASGRSLGEARVTDLEGRFSVRVPEGTSTVRLTVQPAAQLPLSFAQVAVENGNIAYEVADLSGGLVFEGFEGGWRADLDRLTARHRAIVVRKEQVVFYFGQLPIWGRLHGTASGPETTLTVPNLEVGLYELCALELGRGRFLRMAPEELEGLKREGAPCVAAQVHPGGMTSVDVEDLLSGRLSP